MQRPPLTPSSADREREKLPRAKPSWREPSEISVGDASTEISSGGDLVSPKDVPIWRYLDTESLETSGLDSQDNVSGDLISEILEFENLFDLLANDFDRSAICGTDARRPMTHARLYHFLKYELNMKPFGVTHQSTRIGVAVQNGPELAVCIIAAVAGSVCVPMNPQNTEDEILSELQSARVDVVICQNNGKQTIENAVRKAGIPLVLLKPDERETGIFDLQMEGESMSTSASSQLEGSSKSRRGDVVMVLHTSGTSGTKKVVPYTLESVVVGAACIAKSWDLKIDDVAFNMMPLFHIGGIARNLFAVVLSGGSVICTGGFDPVQFWDLQGSDGPTWYYAGPTMHHTILKEAEQRKTVPKHRIRMVCNAAGGLLPSLAKDLRQCFDATILPSYGMTECMPITAPPQSYRLERHGTSGLPVGPEIKILDDNGVSVMPNTPGNICVRGLPLMTGYEGNVEANDAAFFGGGWFNTGDVGYLDANGWLFITGRSKEVINRGGEIVSPYEVEEALSSHAGVHSCIAFSMPHATMQEVVGIAIVPDDNKARRCDLKSLHQFLRDKLHPSKWPEVIVYTPTLPRSASNKLQRIRFAQRCGLPEISEMTPKISRLWQVKECPPKGSPLSGEIPCARIEPNLERIGDTLSRCAEVKTVVRIKVHEQSQEQSVIVYVKLRNTDYKSAVSTKALTVIWNKCSEQLHEYEMPTFIVPLMPSFQSSGDSSGLIDDLSFPVPTQEHRRPQCDHVSPATQLERDVQELWAAALGSQEELSVEADFFELGGTSLMVGQLSAQMRKMFKVRITASHLFSHRTIRSMAVFINAEKEVQKLPKGEAPDSNAGEEASGSAYNETPFEPLIPGVTGVPALMPNSNCALLVLLWQLVPLVVLHPLRCIVPWVGWAYVFVSINYITKNTIPAWASAQMPRLFSFVSALVVMQFLTAVLLPLFFILAKWTIVGRYQEGRYALWGSAYLRWWLVDQIGELCGLGIFGEDSRLLRLYYRLCGATIGTGAKIHKSTVLRECDLVEIGPRACVDHCCCSPFALDRGCMILKKVRVGHDASVCAKTAVAPGHVVPPHTAMGPLSSSYELRDMDKADLKFCRPSFREPHWALKLFVGRPLLLSIKIISLIPWFNMLFLMINEARVEGWYERMTSLHAMVVWFTTPQRLLFYFAVRVVRRCVVPFINLAMVILAKWLVIGKFTKGKWSETEWGAFKRWLFSNLVNMKKLCGVAELAGSHYETISVIYRLLGAKVGKRVYWPGSGLDVIEVDLLDIGDDVVFGSRSLVMPADADEAAPIVIEAGAMVADRCVLLPGVTVGSNACLGSGTLTKKWGLYEANGIYVGSKNRDAVKLGTSAGTGNLRFARPTLKPYGRAFYHKDAPYVVLPEAFLFFFNMLWSGVCSTFHAAPLIMALLLLHPFLHIFDPDQTFEIQQLLKWMLVFFALTSTTFAILALIIDIMAKWMLLGKRSAGDYSWDLNSYCQRWQLYLSMQRIRQNTASHGRGILHFLHGSAYLVWYFRALGAKIGRNVCLYPRGADPMMTEPELVTIGDGACIDDASLVAHINTLGEFSLNPVTVGKNTTMRSSSRLLSGAETEEHAMLLEHTLVLGGDVVERGKAWQGWPAAKVWGVESEIVQEGVTGDDFSALPGSTKHTVVAPSQMPSGNLEARKSQTRQGNEGI